MPARSNLFQRLVLEIHRGLGEGWNVQESCPLTDVITKNSREVDIVAEGEIHGYSICLSVEVCDRSRAADVTWVEGLAKKHESLPTDKLVLWSASGFTDAAKTKAAALKIEIVAPACDAPWAAIAKRMQNSIVRLVLSNLASAVDVRLPDGTLTRWDAPPNMLLTTREGTSCYSIGQLQVMIREESMFGNLMLDNAPNGHGQFHAVFKPPEPCTVTGPDGVVGEVLRVLIDIKTRGQHSRMEVRSALYNDEVTTLAEAQLLSGVFRCAIREPQRGKALMTATYTTTRQS